MLSKFDQECMNTCPLAAQTTAFACSLTTKPMGATRVESQRPGAMLFSYFFKKKLFLLVLGSVKQNFAQVLMSWMQLKKNSILIFWGKKYCLFLHFESTDTTNLNIYYIFLQRSNVHIMQIR